MHIDIRGGIKQLLFAVIRLRVLNGVLRVLIRPLLPVLPSRIVRRIPVVGQIHLPIASSKLLILESDGADSLASMLYWQGLQAFEPETVDLFMRLLKHSGAFLDIGAYTGLFALLAAIGSQDRIVHAFEPVPRTFNMLKRNAHVNRLGNLKPVWAAATNYDGTALLHIPDSTTLPFSASTKRGFRPAKKSIAVPALKIDTYVEANSIPSVGLIKIDTEGTEHEVLEGALTLLDRDRPLIICEVLRGRTESLLHSVLAGNAYRYFHITRGGLIEREAIVGDASYVERNYLFIPEERIPAVLQQCRRD